MKSIKPINFILFFIFQFAFQFLGISQRITLSEPERDDYKGMSFEIIGKINGNFLMYKNIRNTHFISVYDNNMKLIQKENLNYLPDKLLNVDFISYPDYCYMIYQYQRRNVLRCMALKFDSKGQRMGEAKMLDTTYIGLFSDNKIYNTVNSEDKQKIVVYKIQKKYDKFNYTTLLFNQQLELIKKTRITMPYEERRTVLSDFFVDNEGNFVFALGNKIGNRDYIHNLKLIIKDALSDTFAFHSISLVNFYLDEIKLKVDNINKRYLINSFFYSNRHGDIDGLYSALWDKNSNRIISESKLKFSDTLKHEVRVEGSYRMAFNNFFIKDVILKKDGGFLLTGEDYYTQSRANPWNRMDYLYGYPYSSYDYYYNPGFYNPYRYRGYNNNQTRYYYDNVLIMSVSKSGQIEWTNVIHKSQYDDETDKFLSFHLFNTGGDLHFLFNELDRRNRILNDQTIESGGKLIRNPTLKSLDRGYEFMPIYAKQVGAREIIIPCDYRNFICFSKIEY